ncbi:tryptophanase [Alicycliphilus denitrificans]|uniref:Tryptophanase n=1 Tax=Alicycliphilus denitrificans TaxID=179636 RepID=A0A858ZWF1_9BURK|nr:tryptophanase [Alicycliphilus denitrificans]ADV00851.1 Tryptophanase [Alicycliphilus denitrificans BC]QKD45014.1 tryptophanase [Alicycliphilus denitrificans]GAO21325.1 tryptophanase [Alicycliphilus sp. B1]GAO24432.1 tryptophanase [Alicycliphilus sp. B1]
MPKTLIEPFRIKSVEPIRMTTRAERERLLEEAHLNIFKLRAEDVLIDWLTDSGTGAMSARQWGAIMEGDESYAGARSFFRLEKVIQDITGMAHFVPTHQGRAAEKVLFTAVCRKGDLVPNNCHFDTTRGNLEYMGVEAVDVVIAEGLQPATIHPFKGNIDLDRAEALLKKEGGRIPFGMLTVTNNTGGGQPVSMANIRAYSALLKQYGKPFIMDVCRFAENAMFIKMRERGYENTPVREIAREMFSYADGATMSAKKDGMVNIGGFIVLRSDEWLDEVRNDLIMMEGFPTYGGMAGRDLEALAVGLEEGLQEDYLRYRLRTAEYLGERLEAAGVGFVKPTGGHAVYIDARTVLPDMPVQHYPAWALCNALYLEGGIRGVEIGSVMFGKRLEDGTETYHSMELVRLAFPRRMYTQSHFDYAAEVIAEVKAKAAGIRGVRITRQPRFLRHFTCECAWV